MKPRFTDEEVKKIRRLAWLGLSYSIIADDMDAPRMTVYQAARGINYSYIDDPPPIPATQPQKSPTQNLKGKCKRCEILTDEFICKWCKEELAHLTKTAQMS